MKEQIGCGKIIFVDNKIYQCGQGTDYGTIVVCDKCVELSKKIQPDVKVKE